LDVDDIAVSLEAADDIAAAYASPTKSRIGPAHVAISSVMKEKRPARGEPF
jgi:hypothetical protein